MLFKPELIKKIVIGEKTQARRLVQEGELVQADKKNIYSILIKKEIETGWTTEYIEGQPRKRTYPKFIKKREVGQDYSVQPGRGKKGVWYCPAHECFFIAKSLKEGMKHKLNIELTSEQNMNTHHAMHPQPLRIWIIEIRKEKLLDISEEDAKKEGFVSRIDFLQYFYRLTGWLKKDETIGSKLTIGAEFPNPDVWVLDFEVVK